MKKVVCILSDALRYDYIRTHKLKFLKERIERNNCFYAEKVIPSTGFCEIIEFVTGKSTEQHKMLTQVTAKPDWYNGNKNRYLSALNLIDSKVPFRKIPVLNRGYRLFLDKLLNLSNLSASIKNVRYNIPLDLLPFLEPLESKYEYDSFDFGGKDNLFVWMKEHNISYDLSDFVKHNKVRGSDTERMARLKNKISQKSLNDFTLLYIGYGDRAHFLGTNSKEFVNVLQNYSMKLKEIFFLLQKQYPYSQLILLGDHGMIDVDEYINVKSILTRIFKESNLRYQKEYIYFIDSTMVRIWLREKSLIEVIEKKLNDSLGGYIESDQDMCNYLTKFKPQFGDIIQLLKAGYVFFPDFYNAKKIKGMHGYSNRYAQQAGTFISIGSGIKPTYKESLKLSEVKNYIQDLWIN